MYTGGASGDLLTSHDGPEKECSDCRPWGLSVVTAEGGAECGGG